MTDPFREANRLWFRDGRTARALALYAEAAAASPTDPVVAFQLARALWAVDRFAEARDALARAQAHRNGLSDLGRVALDQWQRLSGHDPDRHHPDLPPDRLDRDRLNDYAGDWRRVAEAADERGMGGLAVYALERWGGVPIDAEDARDVDKMLTNRDLEEALVGQLPGPRRRALRDAVAARGPGGPGPGPGVRADHRHGSPAQRSRGTPGRQPPGRC